MLVHNLINFNFLMWGFSDLHETECGEILDNINRMISSIQYDIFYEASYSNQDLY